MCVCWDACASHVHCVWVCVQFQRTIEQVAEAVSKQRIKRYEPEDLYRIFLQEVNTHTQINTNMYTSLYSRTIRVLLFMAICGLMWSCVVL